MAGNFSSYHSDKSMDFNRLSEQIGSSVQKISQNVSSMKKMVTQLGTSSDSEDLRTKLHSIQQYTNNLAKDTKDLFTQLHKFPPINDRSEEALRKMRKERLVNEFSEVLKTFQVLQREAQQKERESLDRARAISRSSYKDFGEDRKSQQLIQLESPVQNQMTLQIEEEIDLEMLREREQSMQQLENDIVSVNEIFRDLATMVHEQGEIVDSIESQMESTQIHVSDAAQQLSKARELQSKVRRKKFFIFVLLIIILAVVIGIIVWATNK